MNTKQIVAQEIRNRREGQSMVLDTHFNDKESIHSLENRLFWRSVSNRMNFHLTFLYANQSIKFMDRQVSDLLTRIQIRFEGLQCGK